MLLNFAFQTQRSDDKKDEPHSDPELLQTVAHSQMKFWHLRKIIRDILIRHGDIDEHECSKELDNAISTYAIHFMFKEKTSKERVKSEVKEKAFEAVVHDKLYQKEIDNKVEIMAKGSNKGHEHSDKVSLGRHTYEKFLLQHKNDGDFSRNTDLTTVFEANMARNGNKTYKFEVDNETSNVNPAKREQAEDSQTVNFYCFEIHACLSRVTSVEKVISRMSIILKHCNILHRSNYFVFVK